jgi:hypothetical protein
MPDPLQFTVEGQVVWVRQSPGPTHAHEVDASALVGAVKDATIGRATTVASPIFLITSRRDRPANFDAGSFSKRFFSFNWSIANQIKSSCTATPVSFSNNLVISGIELFPLQDFQTNAAV